MNKIRLATQEDAGFIRDIYSPYVLNTPVSFETEVPSIGEIRNRIRDTLIKFPWLVFETNNSVVGYSYAGPHRSRCAYSWSVESTVYVHPEFQGKGIGTLLYRTLFELIKSQGVVNIYAGIVLPNNPSVKLHERVGFTSIGVFKDIGYKLDRWWDVGWWQLQLQKPIHPDALAEPVKIFEILEPRIP